jgi:hypothetical protein
MKVLLLLLLYMYVCVYIYIYVFDPVRNFLVLEWYLSSSRSDTPSSNTIVLEIYKKKAPFLAQLAQLPHPPPRPSSSLVLMCLGVSTLWTWKGKFSSNVSTLQVSTTLLQSTTRLPRHQILTIFPWTGENVLDSILTGEKDPNDMFLDRWEWSWQSVH